MDVFLPLVPVEFLQLRVLRVEGLVQEVGDGAADRRRPTRRRRSMENLVSHLHIKHFWKVTNSHELIESQAYPKAQKEGSKFTHCSL